MDLYFYILVALTALQTGLLVAIHIELLELSERK